MNHFRLDCIFDFAVNCPFKAQKTTYRDGADATRLCADHATHRADASVDVVVEDELGDLGGLPAARFPAHHQDTVRVDQLHQLLRTERWKQVRGFMR